MLKITFTIINYVIFVNYYFLYNGEIKIFLIKIFETKGF